MQNELGSVLSNPCLDHYTLLGNCPPTPPPPLPPSIVSVKKKIVSAIHFWSRDWVLIGKSTSWAKLMRNLFCGNEFDLLGIEKKTFFIKGTCSRLNIEAYATHRGLAYWIKNKKKKQ